MAYIGVTVFILFSHNLLFSEIIFQLSVKLCCVTFSSEIARLPEILLPLAFSLFCLMLDLIYMCNSEYCSRIFSSLHGF